VKLKPWNFKNMSINLEEKRKYLLNLLDFPEKQTKIFKEDYVGAGLRKRIKKLLRYRGKYLKYALAKLRMIPDRDIQAKTFWGREFALPLLDANSMSFYIFGTLGWEEHNLIKFFIRNLKKDDIFFDIGANYGFYSALAQEFIQNGEIHAFEPNPKVFNYLKSTFSKNEKRIFLNNIALSDKIGEIPFYDGFPGGHSGKSTILEEIASINLQDYRQIKIESMTLDNYVNTHSKPTVIKMDVEGAESKVIEGGLKILKNTNPIIAMEVHGMNSGVKSSIRAVEGLYDLGYKSYEITEKSKLKPVEKKYLNDQLGYSNFIFIK